MKRSHTTIHLALDAGVGFVVAESVDELIDKLQRIAAEELQPLLTIPAENSGGAVRNRRNGRKRHATGSFRACPRL